MYMKRRDVLFILIICGYITSLKAWGRWKPLRNHMCPSEDRETHECFKMTTMNSSCLVMTFIAQCDEQGANCDRIGIRVDVKPCIIYQCERQGCCDGWVEDTAGICVRALNHHHRNRCKNGGTEIRRSHGCLCSKEYTGPDCGTRVCDPPCENGGRCEMDHGQFTCMCPSAAYTGRQCENVTCKQPCENGGECIRDGVLARCKCPPSFQGDRCQYVINPSCPVITGAVGSINCGAHMPAECTNDNDCKDRIDGSSICCFDGCTGTCMNPIPRTCTFQGHEYMAGATFYPSPCKHSFQPKRCTCQIRGEITCHDIVCSTQPCPGGHTPIAIEGQCCDVCPGVDYEETPGPRFTNCPQRFVSVDVVRDGDSAVLPDMHLEARDHNNNLLEVSSFSQLEFRHSLSTNIYNNIHVVTAFSEWDAFSRRAECTFKVIVKDPFPPVFTSCPVEIFAFMSEKITWETPKVSDNVGIAHTAADGDDKLGKVLDPGTYPVSYTVWDYDQNQAICAFAIRVFRQDLDDSEMPKELKSRHARFISTATIVGSSVGMLLVISIFLCILVRARRHQQDMGSRITTPDTISNRVFSISQPSENMYADVKLPEYSPPMNPPPYEGGLWEEPPIYEEIPSRKAESPSYENIDTTLQDAPRYDSTLQETPRYENIATGLSNPAFTHDNNTQEMEYMKI